MTCCAEATAQRVGSAPRRVPESAEARVLQMPAFGLVQARRPTLSKYDYVVALGGARLSCKFRPLLAAELIRAGLSVDHVVLLVQQGQLPKANAKLRIHTLRVPRMSSI